MFSYLIDKIDKQKFSMFPFKHIYIEDFFNKAHFKKIISSKEVNLNKSKNDTELFNKLFELDYKIVNFPGCVTNKSKYINWHEQKNKIDHSSSCESAGMALRLFSDNEFFIKLQSFFSHFFLYR